MIREARATAIVHRLIPTGGLANNVPADALDPDKSPNLLNVRFRFGEVRPAPGRAPLAPPVASPVQDIARYAPDDRTKWIVMLTDQYLYKWGDAAPATPAAWVQVPGVVLTGSGRWSWCVGEDCFFFARDGGGGIYRWKGGTTSVDMVPGLNDPTLLVTDVTYVEYFNGRLLAGNTVENGKSWANRIRWPINGKHDVWVGEGAGFLDVFEPEQEPIQGLKVLNNRVMVFREHSLIELIATGILLPVFITEQRASNVGCPFPFTIASNGTLVIFLGNDGNVWAWNGTNLQPIGSEIYQTLEQVIDLKAGQLYFGKMYPYANEYWLWLGGPLVYIFDTLGGRWLQDYFPGLAAIGDADLTVTQEDWGHQVGSWGESAKMWRETQARSFNRMLVAKNDRSTVMVGRDLSGTDDNSDVTCMIETKDFYVDGGTGPLLQRTVEKVMLVYNYNNDVDPFEVSVSVDRGRTWHPISHIPNVAGYALGTWKMTGNVARFRFSTTSKRPVFKWIGMVEEFVLAGPYLALEQPRSVAV